MLTKLRSLSPLTPFQHPIRHSVNTSTSSTRTPYTSKRHEGRRFPVKDSSAGLTMPKRDIPARAVKKKANVELRKGKGRARTRAGGLKIIDDPKNDERKLASQLSSMGLYAAHTLGDGNCLFRALSDQLHGTPDHHAAVRNAVCDYLAVNEARYKAFVDTDEEESWEGHLREMRRNGTYGGHLELSAFAHLHWRPIKVIQPGLVYIIGHEDESPAALTRRHNEKLKGKGKERKLDDEDGGETTDDEFGDQSPLYIIYHQWEHYSSVRNIDGPHAGHPRIRERKVLPPSEAPSPPRGVSVPTPETDLLRKSLPLSHSSRFTDQQLGQLIEDNGSWEKTLEVLLGGLESSEGDDEDPSIVTTKDPSPAPTVIIPSPPRGTSRKRSDSYRETLRDPSPATSTSTDNHSSSSTDPSSTSLPQPQHRLHPPLRPQARLISAATRKKPGSRSRSPEPSASPEEGGEGRRQRIRRADVLRAEGMGGGEESDASSYEDVSPSPAPGPSLPRRSITPMEHINTVRADLDSSNERPTRLRPRVAKATDKSGGRGAAVVAKVNRKEGRRKKKEGLLARKAALRAANGARGGNETNSPAAEALFKELRV